MPATRGIRVVLADDDPTYLDALASTLEADGRFEVIGLAGNGAEAFQLGCWQEPDVLVMDAEMPGLGGLDAARLLRQSRPDSRVVLVTSADVVAHCSAPGVDAFVTKSSLDEIPDLVADLVGRLHE